MESWLAENWFNLLSAVGIIGSLVFTTVSFRSETETRRISNLLTLTQSHRELWRELFHNPGLKAVLNPSRNLASKPVTTEEHYFVTMAIQHLHSAFKAMKTGLVTKPSGIKEDTLSRCFEWRSSAPLRPWCLCTTTLRMYEYCVQCSNRDELVAFYLAARVQ